MKIYEFSPFNNENILCDIKSSENNQVVTELHITEFNKTHTFLDKDFNFHQKKDYLSNIFHHAMDGKILFKKPSYGLSRKFPFLRKKNHAWWNDSIQRNIASSFIEFEDDDIIILSDIDEIIHKDSMYKIISDVIKFGIITIRLHVTFYYLNLFLLNGAGPPNFSYRVFIMTGKYFKKMQFTPDKLRKMGEAGKLTDQIYCSDEISGFHHTFLGDEKFIANKLKAYPHSIDDHHPNLFKKNGDVDINYLKYCLQNRVSIFGDNHKLEVNNLIPQLHTVESNRSKYQNLFL